MKTENLAESGLNSENKNAIELLCKNKGKTYSAYFQSNHSPALNPRKRFSFIWSLILIRSEKIVQFRPRLDCKVFCEFETCCSGSWGGNFIILKISGVAVSLRSCQKLRPQKNQKFQPFLKCQKLSYYHEKANKTRFLCHSSNFQTL